MTDPGQHPSPLPALYAPGERLGWIFQDRNLHRRRFLEPPPVPQPVSHELVNRLNLARQRLTSRMLRAGGVGVGLFVLFSCCGSMSSGVDSSSGGGFVILAFLGLAGGAGGMGLIWLHYSSTRSALAQAQAEQQRSHAVAYAGWEARRDEFERAERARVDAMFEWGAATPTPGTRRIDVVGGSIWGWEALLTVLGGSLLRTRGALTLVDFSGAVVCRELVRLAVETGTPYDVKELPADLARTNLLAGLTATQLVDTLVESMYGDSPTGTRADRALDTRILTALCQALEPELTMGRIVGGVRVLMGEPGLSEVLTAQERDHIADELFAEEFRRQAHTNLRRIEAYLHPLVSLGADPAEPQAGGLTCLVAESDGRSAYGELLKDLTVQWLIRRVSARSVPIGSLVVAGADELDHRHLERLSDLCERHDIRLVLLFRHLRDSSVQALGGGAVGFMRLANHEEARQAAEFIGRQHKFVLSQLTRTLGGNETHSIADTDGVSETEGRSVGSTSGRGFFDFSRNRSQSWSVTRNWSQTVSVANGSNWSDAASAQRVYEYAVEPRVLQDLPDYALLLVKGYGSGSVLQAVECDPAIVTLPRVTMDPLPDIPLPDRSEAAIPVSGSPAQAVISGGPSIGGVYPHPAQQAQGVLADWNTGQQPHQPLHTGQIPQQPGQYPPHHQYPQPPPGQYPPPAQYPQPPAQYPPPGLYPRQYQYPQQYPPQPPAPYPPDHQPLSGWRSDQ